MQKITPFLWFDTQAEEAATFYTGIFNNSKIGGITRYGKAGPMPEGRAMTVRFELDGQQFTALNAGPQFKFTEAISFLLSDPDPQKSKRVMEAMLKMKKIDIARLKEAYE